MNSDIIIMPGTTLELCCLLGMPEEGKIIVKQGARLIINEGGSIDNPCGGYWDGVYLEGNKDYLHTDMFDEFGNLKELPETCILNNEFEDNGCYPATIVMNNGWIEHAVCGIRTVVHNYYDDCYEDPHSFGGLILADESNFRNNNRDIAFMQYEPENYSRFTNCTFERTEESFDFYRPHVTMWDVNGVTFDGCIFNNGEADLNTDLFDDNVNYDEYKWKQSSAIYSIGAGYEVVNGCTFNNYGAAIKISSTSYTNDYTINISGEESLPNTFTNNWVGIYAESAKDLVCQENRFVGTGVFDADNVEDNLGTGIAINGSSYYRVLENEFEHLREGVIASNTETVLANENHILRNNFTGMYGCIAALGQNGQLFLDCNDFNSTYDISLESLSGLYGSIKTEQGVGNPDTPLDDEANPVSNRFTVGCGETDNTHFYGEEDGSGAPLYDFFTYYYPNLVTQPRLDPTCHADVVFDKVIAQGEEEDYCDNFNGITTSTDDDDLTPCPVNDLECLADVRNKIDAAEGDLNEGEDPDLFTAILLDANDYDTYQALKSASPYLAEDIIADLILSSMDEYLKGDILIDNSPLSDAAMSLADDYTSDFVYQILYTIKYNETSSAIQLLNIYLDRLETKRNIILQSLIKEKVAQGQYDAAVNLPTIDERAGVKYLLNQLIEQEEYVLAEQVIDAYLADDETYRIIYDFNKRLKEDGHCNLNLTSDEENILVGQATLGGDYSGQARSILSWIANYEFEMFLPQRLEPTAKRDYSFRKVSPLSYKEGILVNPNPVRGDAYLHTWQDVRGGILELYDLGGQKIVSLPLSNTHLNVINLESVEEGIFVGVALNANGSRIGSTKVVVVQ